MRPGLPTSTTLPTIRSTWPQRFGFILFASLTIPPLLLWQAWKTKSFRYKHWLLTAFVTMYGATISITYMGGIVRGGVSDGYFHLFLVHYHYVGLSFEQFLIELWNTLTFQSNEVTAIRDPYKHIVSYLTGGVLGMPGLFFPVVAFVYGYFFTGSMLEIFRHFEKSRLNYVLFGFIAIFFVFKNVEGVNTVRTWTGLWILVYACLKYYDTKNPRYILLMLLPPFVHFGYLIMVIPALIVLVFGNRTTLYAVLFVASSVTNLFPQDIVLDTVTTTDLGARATQSYFRELRGVDHEAVMERVRTEEMRWWFASTRFGIQKWALNVLIYTVLAAGIYFVCMNYRQKSLFSIGLLMLTFSNSLWFLSAVSNRMWVIGCVFAMAAFVMANLQRDTRTKIVAKQPSYYKLGLHFSLLLFIPYFLFAVSQLLEFISIWVLMAPFMVWIDQGLMMSLKELLRILLPFV